MNKIFVAAVIVFAAIFANAQDAAETAEKPQNVYARHEFEQGVKAYKDRRFDLAEQHFRRVRELDPDYKLTDRLLARTLHQQLLARRDSPENFKKGEEAIEIYRKILAAEPNDETTSRALVNLLELARGEQALSEWLTNRADDEKIKPEFRAAALTSLASRKYNCANTITEQSKKVVVKENRETYVFKKPKEIGVFEKARQCADDGFDLINQALILDETNDSAWSYKAALLIQKARLAQMTGNIADANKFQAEADAAKTRFIEVSEEKRKKKESEKQKSISPQ